MPRPTDAVPLILATRRLNLERLGCAHLDDLVTLDSDPEVVRYVGGVSPTREQYEREIMKRITEYDDRPYGFLAAYEAGAFIGWFHLRPSVFDPDVLELGYRLRRSAWGRNLATEGSRAILRHAFETLGEAVVDACALPANVASTRVMVKCGMRRVGSFTHPRFEATVDRYLVARTEVVLDDPLTP